MARTTTAIGPFKCTNATVAHGSNNGNAASHCVGAMAEVAMFQLCNNH
jgi:hypothetical protein